MKKIFFLLFSIALLFGACSSDDDDFSFPKLTADNSIQYTIAHDVTEIVGKKTSVSVLGERIVIDWGDGNIDKHHSIEEAVILDHTYKSETGEYTIKIWGEGLIGLGINGRGVGTYVTSTKINIGNAPDLKFLGINQCDYLASLIVTKCPALESIYCPENKIEEIDLSKNLLLKSLKCDNNELDYLDVGFNTKLESLYCVNNNLISLDIKGNEELISVVCNNNQLPSLHVSNNHKLMSVYIGGNQMVASRINQIFETLPSYTTSAKSTSIIPAIQFADNPGAEHCSPEIIIAKGWKIS